MQSKILLMCCTLLLFVMVGCSDKANTGEDSVKKKELDKLEASEGGESKSTDLDTKVINVLDWEAENFSDTDQKSMQFDKMIQPSSPIHSFVNDGKLIIRGNSYSYFYDYEKGKISPFELEGTGDARISNDMYSDTYLFNSFYYVVEPNRSEGKAYLVEVNVDTGEEKPLLEVSEAVQLSQAGDILYIATGGQLLALDTNLEEEVWKVDLDTSLRFTENEVTDSLVVLLGEEGLAAYSRENGEKLYEVEGYFYNLATDGDTYYVTEENEDTVSDFDVSVLNVLKFTAQNEEGELLYETPELLEEYEEGDYQLDVVGDTLYVKSSNGVIAYDKDGTSPRWILIAGEGLSAKSDTSYDFQTDFAENRVYIRVTKWEHGAEETFFMVADATTGEMIKNLRIDSGETVGPNVDGDQAVIFRKVEDENPEIYIMTE